VAHIHLTLEKQVVMKAVSLGEKLAVVIGSLPPRGVTLAEVRDLFGQDGLLLLTVFLSVVFLVPVSIPGVSTVFGFVIIFVGISRIRGRNLWLPKRIARRVVSADKLRVVLSQGRKWLLLLERVSRCHRLNWLVSTGPMASLNNCGLIVGGFLLMAPFVLVPLTNTLPGIALLFLAIGLLQRDGLCILFGHLANLVTVVYFVILMIGGGVAIHEALSHVMGKAL